MQISNAIIKSVQITNDDHGILTIRISVEHEQGSQGFGGYCLFQPKFPNSPNCAGLFIWRVLEIADVTDWSRLVGKSIRIEGDFSKINKIGHIIKDLWFDPTEEFANLKEQNR